MNNVVLIGRLTRDPEVKYITESQMCVANFSIAIDRPAKKGNDKKTDFPRITVFGRTAENCERYLSKGRLVGVQGRIQTGSYTDRDGRKVFTTGVLAERVEFLEWGDKNDRSTGRSNGNDAPPAADTEGLPPGFQSIQDDDIPF